MTTIRSRCARALALVLSLSALLSPLQPARAAVVKRPKLVVLLVIDQFRADYLLRFESRFLPAKSPNGDVGGFSYLMSQGAYFPMAEYGILQAMTCPGHATALTGAYPFQAGIPLNGWVDTKKGRYQYCAEDESYPTVGAPHREHAGTAPTNMIATTVGDELKNAGLPSKVVSVALKDRSAIMMGGHRADLAFWMHGKERAWVSSKFYLPDGKLPAWLEALNREIQPKAGQKTKWEAPGKGSGLSDPAYVPFADTAAIGKTFPHELPTSEKAALTLPLGVELTAQAAERAFDAHKLGQGAGPDILAVSFSNHDYVGHAFGPNSRQAEEITIHEDRAISRLLNHVRKRVPGGLSNVVIALTADHGAPPDPRWAKSARINAGVIREKPMTVELEKALVEKFGEPKGTPWIHTNHDLNIFVNRGAVRDRKVELKDVLNAIREKVSSMPGIAHAFTSFDYEERKLPPGLLGQQILQTYYKDRSGDVVAIALPFWMVDDEDIVTHITGYTYDRMVPLAIAGPGLKPGVQPAHVRMIDLAPTLSYLLGVLPPALSEGRVLTEALIAGARSTAGSAR
jgi:hypothetical protein